MKDYFYLLRVRVADGEAPPPKESIHGALDVGLDGAQMSGMEVFSEGLERVKEFEVQEVQVGPLGGMHVGGRRIKQDGG